jgi:hypothetical protein
MHVAAIRAARAARRPALAALAAMLLLAGEFSADSPAAAQTSPLVGTYDGNQMEMAAGLELTGDGRFRYALSYGALDEQAAGKWTVSGDQVLLTSDPVVAPRFVLVSHGKGAAGVLQIMLEVPKGISRQYFDAMIAQSNGETTRAQLSEDGLVWPFTGGAPTGVRLVLPVFAVAGEPVKLDAASGYSLRFRFEPNDIGKADFRATPLKIVNGDLLLDRHGRTIRFKRSSS